MSTRHGQYRIDNGESGTRWSRKIIMVTIDERKRQAERRDNVGSFRVRSTNGLRVTPPISMKFGTLADNA